MGAGQVSRLLYFGEESQRVTIFIYMPDQSWNSSRSSSSSRLPDLGPSVPAPPPEVKVRTLRSDLASLSQSGGMRAEFKSVAAPVVAKEDGMSSEVVATNKIKTIVAVVVALALIVGVGFFAHKLFFGDVSRNPSLLPISPSPSAKPSGAASFVHASVFKQPADQVLALTIPSGSVENAAELETFNQRMFRALNGTKPSSVLLEVNVKDESGADLPLADILRAGDMEVIDPAFFAAHFNPDGSLFVYKDARGFWPGFVFALNPADNWLFVKDDVARLEDSPKVANFFLTAPGVPAAQNFKDAIIKDAAAENQSVRRLEFSIPGAVFIYGWFRNALIISTSEDGLREAIGRL
ncbi:MAG: hypothetical protein A2945_01785 [Candidatus Liptonbacteria bacterium RIFCSPLOWO2_01_FULL_52_25]|uniref:Uncharacterized protein n=1 Tax=Candidatus Liptonbacteria bacterium RIFCSPLOWO2_01_FULL_52_25 TaxID=1798650 RepID=A0A1G2CES6_9BACT|nr:MAG: hypothetical protein A2945_01785 [Candidatus Liptonbacteria bacterium RIFCSPLOWO2_01_FULL_52_25]